MMSFHIDFVILFWLASLGVDLFTYVHKQASKLDTILIAIPINLKPI